jgi:hypothetical protein
MPRRHIDPVIVSHVYPSDSTENSRSFNFHAGYLKKLAKFLATKPHGQGHSRDSSEPSTGRILQSCQGKRKGL